MALTWVSRQNAYDLIFEPLSLSTHVIPCWYYWFYTILQSSSLAVFAHINSKVYWGVCLSLPTVTKADQALLFLLVVALFWSTGVTSCHLSACLARSTCQNVPAKACICVNARQINVIDALLLLPTLTLGPQVHVWIRVTLLRRANGHTRRANLSS